MSERRKKPKLPREEYTVTIESMSSEGFGIAKRDGKVVFVEGGIEGDEANVQVLKKKSQYEQTQLLSIIKASEFRVEPLCRHFGLCGGCKWQYADYQAQLNWKNQTVLDSFQRIGKINISVSLPILRSPLEYRYRNKLEFSFSSSKWLTEAELKSDEIFDRRALGFHLPGHFDKILDIQECLLMPELINEIRNFIKSHAIDKNLTFFNSRDKSGFLRNVMFRYTDYGELLVLLVVSEYKKDLIEDVCHQLQVSFPQITSLYFSINNKVNDTYLDCEMVLYHGKDSVIEKLGDILFKIGPKSFFQTNSKQAVRMYESAREMAGLTGKELLYDLYCGVGSIGLFMADRCSKVIGIEEIESAVKDAEANRELNQLNNCSFFAGDVKRLLNHDLYNTYGVPDVLITDPPRAGMHEDVCREICNLRPKKVVYISCNPSTQARDIQLMNECYEVAMIQPIDMFPHTKHIENIALLIKK